LKNNTVADKKNCKFALFLRNTLITFCIILSILLFIKIKTNLTKPLAHVKPNYEKTSIVEILNKNEISDDDYKELFYQTGLGHSAIDSLLEDKVNGKIRILKFQENLFKDINVFYQRITPITYQENIKDNDGKFISGTDLAPYKNGYILVTRATHSLGWRHGHAAIVADSYNGNVLEAAVLGEDSQISDINSWKYYPNFMILKLKDADQTKLDEIAEYAVKKLYKIPYKLTSGIFSTKYKDGVDPNGTHCSHLVWYPFKKFGYDLDSNGGMIVTPQDIAKSPYLEIIQVYGFNPKELWK
jgi:uncharacterized protein YycO